MRTITLEEHYANPEFLDGPGKEFKEQAEKMGPLSQVLEKLADLDSKRIAEMDAAGIDVQVLSLNSPGTEQMDAAEAITMARQANDFVAGAMKRHPERFAGFAALPTADPAAAVRELDRTVNEYGFKGANINGHTKGRYLDDKFFWPILERAQALDVPIYIHPTQPPKQVSDVYYSGFAPMVNSLLQGAGWGWHIETAVHVIRLIMGGVFDKYPKLQVIVGHLGETLPFMMQRMDVMVPQMTNLQRPISAYLRENVHYTISGFNFTQTFLGLFLEVGADRIMFSADYPYSSMQKARAFLDSLPISPADREKIAHGNAGRLLRM